MKKKDMIFALLAVVILLVAGYIGYTQLAPKSTTATNTVEVEKVGVIPADLDTGGLKAITDTTRVLDFNAAVDLTGLGTAAPFGQ